MILIKAIVINPYACTIEPVQIEDDYRAWYAPLTTPLGPVTIAERIQLFPASLRPAFLAPRDSILVDEEGSFKPHTRWFAWQGAYQPFAGNGLVIGTRGEKQADVQTTLEALRGGIWFMEGARIDEVALVT